MKIIFLDIDGVICVNWIDQIDEFGHGFNNDYVKNLQTIIEKTDAKIVISSTWRKSGLPEMQRMWEMRNLPGKVIDITPVLWTKRGEEIAEYLRENPCDSYAIIDDDNDFLDEQKPFFVRTSVNEHDGSFNGLGLTKKCAEKAIQILNKTNP
jgi:hypothetical protein